MQGPWKENVSGYDRKGNYRKKQTAITQLKISHYAHFFLKEVVYLYGK